MTDALLEIGLPKLDRGGEFLAMKTASALVDEMGSADDDHGNAFTIRMLFLLESQPLIGESAYDELFRLVSGAYRSTAKQHAEDFLPFYFVNDVVRYWRTVLLNHEDRLRSKAEELAEKGTLEADLDEELLAHRRYRSQRLRFPRYLSCFSSLASSGWMRTGDPATSRDGLTGNAGWAPTSSSTRASTASSALSSPTGERYGARSQTFSRRSSASAMSSSRSGGWLTHGSQALSHVRIRP